MTVLNIKSSTLDIIHQSPNPSISKQTSPFSMDYLDKLKKATKNILMDQRESYHKIFDQIFTVSSPIKEMILSEEVEEKIKILRKDFFCKNLDKASFMPSSIQGSMTISSIYILLHELEDYLKSPNLTAEEQKEVNQAIECLKTMYAIEVDLSCLQVFHKNNLQEVDEILKHLSKHITDKLALLKKGEKLALPGGTPNHDMIYEFIRTGGDDQKPIFSMKIYNSGAGTDHHSTKGLKLLHGAKYRTYMVENISLKQIAEPQASQKESFIYEIFAIKLGLAPVKQSIFSFCFLHDSPDTCSIYRLVKMTLLNTGAKINKSGQAHYEQQQGSCTRKCRNFLLKESLLSTNNYLNFKVHATKSSLDRLQHLSQVKGEVKKTNKFARYAFHQSVFARIHFSLKDDISNEAMLDLGHKVLKRRQKKAAKAAAAA